MTVHPRDWMLFGQVVGITKAQALARRVRDRVQKLREERGQTPTEYLMIVGLMAVVIITVFVFFYWNNVKSAAQKWVNNVKQSVLGSNIKKT